VIYATVTIERGEREVDVEIEGHVEALRPGRYHGPPERCYPDEGGDVEIETAVCAHCGQAVELDDKEREQAEAALVQRAQDMAEAAAEDAALSRMED